MSSGSTRLSADHRAVLAHELMHGSIVLIVTMCASVIYLVQPAGIPSDLLGFVFGGALQYAGTAASRARSPLNRRGDSRASM